MPVCKDIEKKNKLGLNKISAKRKGDRIIDRLNKSLSDYKYIKTKKHLTLVYRKIFLLIINTFKTESKKTKIFKQKFCFYSDLFIETTS